MVWFLIILLFVVFSSSYIAEKNQFIGDYLSKEKTNTIKGIFVILIVFGHYLSYTEMSGVYDEPFTILYNHLGQMVVAMFLFYSGYGIMESILKKGFSYIQQIPTKRLKKVWVNFSFVVLIYLILGICLGNKYKISTILLAFIGWTSLGNSNWYMFAIMSLYLLTFVAFYSTRYLKSKYKYYYSAIVLTLLTVAMVYGEMKVGQPSWFYNTSILFPLGVWYSLFKNRIEKVIMKNDLVYSFICLIMIICYMITCKHRGDYGIEGYSVWAIIFTLTIVFFTMKISFNSVILKWFGEHVFSIYILQRIPMIILRTLGYTETHKYVSLIISFIATIFIAQAFDAAINIFWQKSGTR